MRSTPLNLATRPVRNERLPALLFLLAAFALFLVTIQHGFILYRLRPGASRALHAEVERLRTEGENLTTEGGRLRGVSVNAKEQAEWNGLKRLIDRRTFWWSKLFQVLEQTLPREVRVVSLSPRVKDNERYIDMLVRVQGVDDGFNFVPVLEGRPEFADVQVRTYNESSSDNGPEIEFALTMRYLAPESVPATPPPVPTAPSQAGATAPAAGGRS